MKKDERGVAHLLLVLLILVVLAVMGGAGWYVYNRQKDSGSSVLDTALSSTEVKQLNTECNKQYDDEDLCKFLSTWTVNDNYQSTFTTVSDGESSTFAYTVDGTSTHTVMSLNGVESYNVITIGDTTYTYNQSNDSWWKETAAPADDTTVSSEDFKFDTGIADEAVVDNTMKYEFVAKEACGKLTCFKYKLTDTANLTSTSTLWFDVEDYLLRKWISEDVNGTTEMNYSYEDISVDAPSPTKDLPAGSVVLPDGTVYTP